MSILSTSKKKNRIKSKSTHVVFDNKIKSAIGRLSSEFIESSSFEHSVTKGSEREIPVHNFFRNNLPKNFSITKGEVVDCSNQVSSQIDCIIYDSNKNIAFTSSDNSIVPAEAVLSCIEIKTDLTTTELEKCLKAVKKLKDLKPYGNELASPRIHGNHGDGKPRYLYSIFAYKSSIGSLNNIVLNLKKKSDKLGIDHRLIDSIYVMGVGLIHPFTDVGFREEDKAFLNFYMQNFSFLVRENSRRKVVPYWDYVGTRYDLIKF